MQILGVKISRPSLSKWQTFDWMVTCAGSGFLLGFLVQQVVGGSLRPVLGLGLAGLAAGTLMMCGANPTSAGWRGVALTIVGALFAFLATDVLMAL